MRKVKQHPVQDGCRDLGDSPYWRRKAKHQLRRLEHCCKQIPQGEGDRTSCLVGKSSSVRDIVQVSGLLFQTGHRLVDYIPM